VAALSLAVTGSASEHSSPTSRQGPVFSVLLAGKIDQWFAKTDGSGASRSGTAASTDEARAWFERAWKVLLAKRPPLSDETRLQITPLRNRPRRLCPRPNGMRSCAPSRNLPLLTAI
jgi:hypothetical protein